MSYRPHIVSLWRVLGGRGEIGAGGRGGASSRAHFTAARERVEARIKRAESKKRKSEARRARKKHTSVRFSDDTLPLAQKRL
jgi:hypothetical protein